MSAFTVSTRPLRIVLASFAVLIVTIFSVVTSAPGRVAAAPVGATDPAAFAGVQPCRLLDTRPSNSPLPASGTVAIAVGGRCGVAEGAVVAAVTVTVVGPASTGFLTAFPTGTERPTASFLNYRAGDVIANHQFVRLDAEGSMSIFSLASTQLVVDVTGYFAPASGGRARAGRFVSTPEQRLVDTRDAARPTAGQTIRIDPVLGADATAVAINITTTAATAPGYFTAFPAGSARPNASVLNVDGAGQTRAAFAIVPISDGGIDVYTSAGNHVIVDLLGYFTDESANRTSDGLYIGVGPTRLVDTRLGYGAGGGPRLWDGGGREFAVAGLVGTGIAAVAGSITVTQTEDLGFAVSYPAGRPLPPTSAVNYDRAQHTAANFMVTQVSDRGIGVHALQSTHVIIDVVGWFLGEEVTATEPVPRNDPPPDRRVTIIGDSAIAGIRWNGALGGFQGFEAVAKLESCRRLATPSCRGREGYVPRDVVGEIDALATAGPEEIVVIATGYNDWHSSFADDFDAVVAAARRKGFHHIVWVDYRSNVGYLLPSSGGTQSNYGEMNQVIDQKLASGAFPEVRRWRFDRYTSAAVGWFASDGVHETLVGSWGVADWISRHVRAYDERPCAQPWAVGGAIENPCPDPDVAGRGVPDIATLYGL